MKVTAKQSKIDTILLLRHVSRQTKSGTKEAKNGPKVDEKRKKNGIWIKIEPKNELRWV